MRELDTVLENMKEGVEYPFLLEFLEEPSKRIRSKLAILYLKYKGVNLSSEIYNILSAGELIHNASLLHDDVIDDAESRRGKTTIGVKISPKISILAGDYLVSKAMSKILGVNNPEIFNIFETCIKNMCEAEFKQFFLRGQIPTEDDYINICNGKTACLFASILESCAILADINREDAKNLGMKFGLYFQIKNDLEEKSSKEDEKNKIYTAKTVLGIEKTLSLLDNLKEEIVGVFPEIKEFEGLVN